MIDWVVDAFTQQADFELQPAQALLILFSVLEWHIASSLASSA